ncbi:MAG: hypothetical protein JWQ20_3714 [Conexibacter sp.]|jgi:uncharacterized protein (DUF2267 family)|nr:hypothetical protein [Conexibacter sp.]
MTVASVNSVERTVHKTNEWLKELTEELGNEERDDAWRILRGFLPVLRDRLTLDEGAQLAAELTPLVRGVFYEGFDPGRQPEKIRQPEAFVARIGEQTEIDDPEEAALAAVAVMNVMARHIAEGELDDILSQLPQPIRDVLQPVET